MENFTYCISETFYSTQEGFHALSGYGGGCDIKGARRMKQNLFAVKYKFRDPFLL